MEIIKVEVPKVKRQERSSQKENNIAAHSYVHADTAEEVANHISQMKETSSCPTCQRPLDNKGLAAEQHIWNHFLVYMCQCKEFVTDREDLRIHLRGHQNETKKYHKICALLFTRAQKELGLSLPATFPISSKPLKVMAVPRRKNKRYNYLKQQYEDTRPDIHTRLGPQPACKRIRLNPEDVAVRQDHKREKLALVTMAIQKHQMAISELEETRNQLFNE